MKTSKIFSIFLIIALCVLGYMFFRGDFKNDNPVDIGGEKAANISMTTDVEYKGLVVEPLVLADKTIEFPHTDDNEGETLIIKSDRDLYYSDSSRNDVFVSVTNTTDIAQNLALIFYFPGDQKAEPATLELYKDGRWEYVTFYKNNIKINKELLNIAIKKRETIPKTIIPKAGAQISISADETIYLKTIITYEPDTEGEFWIETLGDKGSYGLLDPLYGVKIRGGLGRGLNLLNMFNGSGTNFPGGSPASGGFDDYNNAGSPPTDRYSKPWTQCNSGNNYCGTGDNGADAMDNSTRLVWSLPCNGSGCSSFSDSSPLSYTWDKSGGNNNSKEAFKLCSQGNHGKTGWYLPHQKQLMQAYIDGSYGNLETAGISRNYWSATTRSSNTANAWYVHLSDGSTNNLNKTNFNYIRCVRSLAN